MITSSYGKTTNIDNSNNGNHNILSWTGRLLGQLEPMPVQQNRSGYSEVKRTCLTLLVDLAAHVDAVRKNVTHAVLGAAGGDGNGMMEDGDGGRAVELGEGALDLLSVLLPNRNHGVSFGRGAVSPGRAGEVTAAVSNGTDSEMENA